MRHSPSRGVHDFARAVAVPPLAAAAAGQLAVPGISLAAAVQPLGWRGQVLALALYGAIGALALRGLGAHAPHRRFGMANAVTAARAAAAALLLGAWGEAALSQSPPGDAMRWVLTAVAAAALASDGLDGWLARRYRLSSDFGARFDMETDALLVLALALLVFTAGQAGIFVLLSGAMRYLFVAAGRAVPALAAPLPPSRRRKAVCVVQTAVLVVALAPAVPPSMAAALCLGGLGLLIYSFGVDCAGALSRARGSPIMTEHAYRDARF
ncbi:MAG TPA: CDP-alcohol phosphatidyltransferase family protein [Stellaceae bacterium]|nr:CDP-alcohol phosphatidyltransferase family protein [Stellaceae bacterium]